MQKGALISVNASVWPNIYIFFFLQQFRFLGFCVLSWINLDSFAFKDFFVSSLPWDFQNYYTMILQRIACLFFRLSISQSLDQDPDLDPHWEQIAGSNYRYRKKKVNSGWYKLVANIEQHILMPLPKNQDWKMNDNYQKPPPKEVQCNRYLKVKK